mgnify:CR=1 FL=1
MIAVIGIRYRYHAHHILYRSCLPIYGIAIIRSPSFLFLDDLEGKANISVAIKSGSTVDGIAALVRGERTYRLQHFVFGVMKLIDYLILDIPTSVDTTIKREQYLAKQALTDHQVQLLVSYCRGVNCTDKANDCVTHFLSSQIPYQTKGVSDS